MNLNLNPFKTVVAKSVDSVMSAFHQAIADLKEVQERNVEAADQHLIDADISKQKANVAVTEAKRAAKISAQLEALVAA